MKHSRVSLNKPRRTHKRRVSAHKKTTKIKRPHKTKKTNRNLKSEPFIFPNYIGGNLIETETNTVLDNPHPQPDYSPPSATPVPEPVSDQFKDDDNALPILPPPELNVTPSITPELNVMSKENTETPETLPEPVSENTNTEVILDEPNNEAQPNDIDIATPSSKTDIEDDLTPYKNDERINDTDVLDNTIEEYNTNQSGPPSILVGSDDSNETPSEIHPPNEEIMEDSHSESIITEPFTKPEMPVIIPEQPPQIEDIGTNMKTESINPYAEETLESVPDKNKVEPTSPISKPIFEPTRSSNTSSQLDSVVDSFVTLIADKIIAQLNTKSDKKSPIDKMGEALQSLDTSSIHDQGGGGRKASSNYSIKRPANTKKRRHYLYNRRTKTIRRMDK
jgi:hypothetical protein